MSLTFKNALLEVLSLIRRFGPLERMIDEAFRSAPSSVFTVENLVKICFPGVEIIEKKHRVSVIRAANKLAIMRGWQQGKIIGIGQPILYFNGLNVRSYSSAQILINNFAVSKIDVLKMIDKPDDNYPWWEWSQPGGIWWLQVEINKAAHDGRLREEIRLKLIVQDIYQVYLEIYIGILSIYIQKSRISYQ